MRPPALLVSHAPQSVAVVLALVLGGGGLISATSAAPGPERAVVAETAADPSPLADTAVAPDDPSPDPVPTAPAPVPAPAKAAPASPVVAPLGELRVADLVVRLTRPLTPAQAAALAAGVDPSQFRAFTPQETAASDALWQSVARGELAPSYALQRSRGLTLGNPLTVDGAAAVEGRIGAVAAYGLPGVDLVTDRATARALGVVPSSTVLVSAPDRGIAALRKAVQAVLGADATVEVLRPVVVAPRTGGPKSYRDLNLDGARYCPGLSWTVLAAIGQVESAHGKFLGPSSAGALGPMPFLPSTWADYGVDGDGDGSADIMSPYDAIPSAAGYLCRFGAARGADGLYDAIFADSHLDAYVQKVLATARAYGGKFSLMPRATARWPAGRLR